MAFRLTVTPPDGSKARRDATLTREVAGYGALVILMNADPAFWLDSPASYPEAREFSLRLIKAPLNYELKHHPTGYVFSIG